MFEGCKSERGNKNTKRAAVRAGKQMVAVCRNRCVLILIIVVNHTPELPLLSLALFQVSRVAQSV
jgi:hypothetical protein